MQQREPLGITLTDLGVLVHMQGTSINTLLPKDGLLFHFKHAANTV